jgi:hypothetical protein|tara:strand:- start:178 stop:360 length:183 start_codon:yes stop_codon:yes gene_type:complete
MRPLLITIFLLGAILLVSASDSELEQDADQEYCEMVTLFQQSNGDLGWPDYKNTYEKGCK